MDLVGAYSDPNELGHMVVENDLVMDDEAPCAMWMLPDEILLSMLTFLPVKDLCSVVQVRGRKKHLHA